MPATSNVERHGSSATTGQKRRRSSPEQQATFKRSRLRTLSLRRRRRPALSAWDRRRRKVSLRSPSPPIHRSLSTITTQRGRKRGRESSPEQSDTHKRTKLLPRRRPVPSPWGRRRRKFADRLVSASALGGLSPNGMFTYLQGR